MSLSTRSKRHKPDVNRKEEMADQSIFKNLLDKALGPITQELKLLAKASFIEERLKTLEETLEEEFEKRIKEQDARIEGLKSKVTHLEGKVTSLNKTLSKLESISMMENSTVAECALGPTVSILNQMKMKVAVIVWKRECIRGNGSTCTSCIN